MGFVIILGFHGAVLTVLLFVFHYLLGDAVETDILYLVGIYTGMMSILNMVLFIPLFFMNKLYHQIQLKHHLSRNIIDDLGKVLAVCSIVFLAVLIYQYGSGVETFTTMLEDYLD